MSEQNNYLSAFDELSKMVELMSGIKAQFVEQGWREPHSEIATIELILGRAARK